jgi:hypothetical protein
MRQLEEQDRRCNACWPPVALADVIERLPADAREPIMAAKRRGGLA